MAIWPDAYVASLKSGPRITSQMWLGGRQSLGGAHGLMTSR
jgi:hypothetical protein